MAATEAGALGPFARAIRAVEAQPWGRFWLSAAIAAVLVAANVIWFGIFAPNHRELLGAGPLAFAISVRIHLVMAFVTAFVVAMSRHDHVNFSRDLERLQPMTRLTRAEIAALATDRTRLQRAAHAAAMVGGMFLGVAVLIATNEDPGHLLRADAWDAHLLGTAAANALLFAMMGGGVAIEVARRPVVSRMAAAIVRIDLLDRSDRAPFAHLGLRSAFTWAGASTIASLLALDIERVWPIFAIIAATLTMATFALVGPARAIRARIRDEKRSELTRVRERIRRARDEALTPSVTGATALPGLLAYEARIESVSDWPFDAPTLARFAVLLALATGSWLGGAVMERLLGSILDR